MPCCVAWESKQRGGMAEVIWRLELAVGRVVTRTSKGEFRVAWLAFGEWTPIYFALPAGRDEAVA